MDDFLELEARYGAAIAQHLMDELNRARAGGTRYSETYRVTFRHRADDKRVAQAA